MIVLTRSGERMIERAFPAWERALEEARAAFGEKRIREVHAQLGRIVATVDGFVGTGVTTGQVGPPFHAVWKSSPEDLDKHL
ncbi:MAG: hypothetical protein A2V77_17675 [Anaeromyxobacter sp. RBG_16_69_14]|jgi:hypothetical protein|nr:MAG: hypothetical protein A2V77_17675 [Anaeromyxobacter sp. RBG_16_69_14]